MQKHFKSLENISYALILMKKIAQALHEDYLFWFGKKES